MRAARSTTRRSGARTPPSHGYARAGASAGRRAGARGRHQRRPRRLQRPGVSGRDRAPLRVRAAPPDGVEEARTTFRGVTSRRPAGAGTVICDIGGGSTEFVLGDRARAWSTRSASTSAACGCPSGSSPSRPTAAGSVAALRAAVAEVIPTAITERGARADRRGRHDHHARHHRPRPRVRAARGDRRPRADRRTRSSGCCADLSALSLDELQQVRGLMPARAPTIVAGSGDPGRGGRRLRYRRG